MEMRFKMKKDWEMMKYIIQNLSFNSFDFDKMRICKSSLTSTKSTSPNYGASYFLSDLSVSFPGDLMKLVNSYLIAKVSEFVQAIIWIAVFDMNIHANRTSKASTSSCFVVFCL